MNIIQIIIFFVLLLDKCRKYIQLKNENSLSKSWFLVLNIKSFIRFWHSNDIFRQFRNNKIVKLLIFKTISFTIRCKYPRSFFSLIDFADHFLVTLEKVTLKRLSPCLVAAMFQRNNLVEIHYGKLTSNEHPNIWKMLSFRSPLELLYGRTG